MSTRDPIDRWDGTEDRDHPLVLRYLAPINWLKPLGLPAAASRHERAREQIAAIALDVMRDQLPWVSYSRNKNHYARRGSRYDERPELYSYAAIPPAVDALAAAGFLENIIAPNNPHCGWQSKFRAAPTLAEALGKTPPPVAKPKRRALIRLRDKNKQLIDFRDTERTTRMAHNVAEINEAISPLVIGLPETGERFDDLLTIGDSCVNLGNISLYRVFNEDWQHGGRLYGHYVQSLPKEIRRQLTINGEPVAEPDYPAHHLRILCALEGLPLARNPYDLAGWEREIVKRAMLILINADTMRSAIGALIHRYGISGAEAAHLIREVKRKHAPIARYFHSGAGGWLQRRDSDIAERVLHDLRRQGVVAMPIHDSFVVQERDEDRTRETMETAFATVICRERGASPMPKPYQELKAKTTYTMVATFLASVPPSYPVATFLASVPPSYPEGARRPRCVCDAKSAPLFHAEQKGAVGD